MEIAVETDGFKWKYFPVNGGEFRFKVRASTAAYVLLTTTPDDSEPLIQVHIGGVNNTQSWIIRAGAQVSSHWTSGILSATEARGFWVRWGSGLIQVGRDGEEQPFMEWLDPEPFDVVHCGVGTWRPGTWLLDGNCVAT